MMRLGAPASALQASRLRAGPTVPRRPLTPRTLTGRPPHEAGQLSVGPRSLRAPSRTHRLEKTKRGDLAPVLQALLLRGVH
eukprot:1112078-Alexandrium_andersonii.AAC.1